MEQSVRSENVDEGSNCLEIERSIEKLNNKFTEMIVDVVQSLEKQNGRIMEDKNTFLLGKATNESLKSNLEKISNLSKVCDERNLEMIKTIDQLKKSISAIEATVEKNQLTLETALKEISVEANQRSGLESRLDKAINNLKTAIKNMQESLESLKHTQAINKTEMQNLVQCIDSINSRLDQFSETLDYKINRSDEKFEKLFKEFQKNQEELIRGFNIQFERMYENEFITHKRQQVFDKRQQVFDKRLERIESNQERTDSKIAQMSRDIENIKKGIGSLLEVYNIPPTK